MFELWIKCWELVPDGEPIITFGSRLLPVRMGDVPAMLKNTAMTKKRSATC